MHNNFVVKDWVKTLLYNLEKKCNDDVYLGFIYYSLNCYVKIVHNDRHVLMKYCIKTYNDLITLELHKIYLLCQEWPEIKNNGLKISKILFLDSEEINKNLLNTLDEKNENSDDTRKHLKKVDAKNVKETYVLHPIFFATLAHDEQVNGLYCNIEDVKIDFKVTIRNFGLPILMKGFEKILNNIDFKGLVYLNDGSEFRVPGSNFKIKTVPIRILTGKESIYSKYGFILEKIAHKQISDFLLILTGECETLGKYLEDIFDKRKESSLKEEQLKLIQEGISILKDSKLNKENKYNMLINITLYKTEGNKGNVVTANTIILINYFKKFFQKCNVKSSDILDNCQGFRMCMYFNGKFDEKSQRKYISLLNTLGYSSRMCEES